MNRPVIKDCHQSTHHADGTVSYWNVERQQGERQFVATFSERALASLPYVTGAHKVR